MPNLRWRDAGAGSEKPEVVGGTCVKHGKNLWLCGDDYAEDPTWFSAYHRLGFVLRRYCERKQRPTIIPVGKPQRVLPRDANGEFSAGPLKLPTPGRRLKWRIFFMDGAGHESDELHVSRIGSFEPPQATVLGTGVNLPIVFTVAVDPEVELSVLTPWETEGWSSYLRELAGHVRDEGERVDDAVASLSAYLGAFLPEESPTDWSFDFDEDRFSLAAGESAHCTLSLEMPTPGGTVFAVRATGEVDGEMAQAVSDPLIARMPDDGSETAELFGGDEGDSGSGQALPLRDTFSVDALSALEASLADVERSETVTEVT